MRKILKFGFQYIKKWKGIYSIYLILSFLNSLIGISLPLLLGMVINVITESQRRDLLMKYVLAFFLLSVLQQLLAYVTKHMYLKLQSNAGYYANMEMIKKIYASSYLNVLQEDPALLNQKGYNIRR